MSMGNEEILAKIEELKTTFTAALDELAASVGGEPVPEEGAAEATMEGETAPEAPAPAGGMGAAPGPFKKKPKGDMLKGLGI